MKTAHLEIMLNALQSKLMNGTAQFIYRKKDGSSRVAFGTLLHKVVTKNTNGWGEQRSNYGLQAYFDIEDQAWRSFRYENLLAVLA